LKPFLNPSLLVYLLPISLILGPLIAEINVFFLILYYFIKLKKIELSRQQLIFLKFFLLFYFIILINSFFSDFYILTFNTYFFYFRIGIYSLAVSVIIDSKYYSHKWMYNILITTFIILILIGFFELLFGNYFRNSLFTDIDPKRVSSLFGNEKILGSYVLKIVPVMIFLIFKLNSNYNKQAFVLLFLSLFIIILSGERTAIIFFLFFIIIFVYVQKSKFYKKILSIILFFLIYFLIVNLNDNIFHRNITEIKSIINDFRISEKFIFITEVNTDLVKKSFEMIKSNLLFGSGVKSFRYLCIQEIYMNISKTCSTHPHNFYIQLLVETGIVGFCFLFGIFILLSIKLLISYNSIKFNLNPHYILYIGIFINIFPISQHGNFFNNWLSIIIYLPIGFLLSELNIKNKK
jgi:O-antigen ligase